MNDLSFFSRALCLLGLTISLAGCALRDEPGLEERVPSLEREVLATRTHTDALSEALHDVDLRVEYLEKQAALLGIPFPPADAAGENVVPQSQPPKQPPASKPAQKPAPKPAKKPASKPASKPTPKPDLPASPAPAESSPPSEPQQVSSTPADTPVPPAPVQSAPAQPKPTAAQSERGAYNTALQLYRTGRFAEAEAAFQAFLEVFPNSGLVPNALYWKGETHYSRGQFNEAIFAFKDVQTRFPQHPKTPDSLLKTAMAYQRLGDTGNASLHMTVLYEDWPTAEATQRARSKGLVP